MNRVHLTLQGKGGVGKSLVTALIAQWHEDKGRPTVNIDTDPVNATLRGYKALNVHRIELMDENDKLNERNFDQLIEKVLSEESDFIVDNGASSFLPLSSYMVENQVPQLITGSGKELVIHTVITGGQALTDTLTGFKRLCEQMPPEARIIVWLNEYFGSIASDGKSFEEMKVYQANKERVSGMVRIAKQTGDTFGKDFETMLDNKMTFKEAAESPTFGLMAKQRLTMMKRGIFQQLDAVL